MGIRGTTAGLAVLALFASAPVLAYVGPGAGLTLLSALWGLVIAVAAAMAFLVLWPIRRWRRRRQEALESGADLDEEGSAPPSAVERRPRKEDDARR